MTQDTTADRPDPRAPLDAEAVRAALTDVGPLLGTVAVVAATASTSSDLVAAAAADPGTWPDRSVLVTHDQQAGRGRSGRTWTTPPGAALTFSVLLRPRVGLSRLGWVPLLTGLAVARALDDVAGLSAALKWPNDVLVTASDAPDVPGWGSRRKVAGVLSELVADAGPAGPAVVVGIGVNVDQTADELPVPSAGSVRTLGGEVHRVTLLAAALTRLLDLDQRWRAADGDARAAGLAQDVAAACATLGQDVVVDLPGGEELRGTAVGLADDGALEVRADGRVRTVLAGDVRHVRSAGPEAVR